MQLDVRGEQRQSIFNIHYPAGTLDYDQTAVLDPSRPMTAGEKYDAANLDQALLRMMGLELSEARKGRIELKAYIDMPSADEYTQDEGNPHFLGRAFKRYNEEEGAIGMFLRIDPQARSFINAQYPKSLTLVNIGAPLKWSKLNIALHTNAQS
jgi:hypothetical protein